MEKPNTMFYSMHHTLCNAKDSFANFQKAKLKPIQVGSLLLSVERHFK